jgi:hypothetical protein
MNDKNLLVFFFAMIPCISLGAEPQNFQCTNGDLQRRVEVVFDAGSDVSCEVNYYKDTEAPGKKQVLWRAVSEVDYCANHAEMFIAKLEGWGWICNPGGDSEARPSDDAESTEDDTDVMLPGDSPESTEDR